MLRSRATGPAPAAVAVLLALAAATGCGSEDGTPHSYPTSETKVSAHVGEEFTLAVDEIPGEHTYLVDPRPDASVVRSTGDDREQDDDARKMPGASTRHLFAFKAAGTGSTEIVLLHCPVTACPNGPAAAASPSPSGSPSVPGPTPRRITYTVTVS